MRINELFGFGKEEPQEPEVHPADQAAQNIPGIKTIKPGMTAWEAPQWDVYLDDANSLQNDEWIATFLIPQLEQYTGGVLDYEAGPDYIRVELDY